MRLIDADVFKTEYENLITWVSHRAEKARLREFIKDIQNQPTIDAIPIEWLRMWFMKNGYLSGMALVDKIETDWEKESEQNKENTSQTD